MNMIPLNLDAKILVAPIVRIQQATEDLKQLSQTAGLKSEKFQLAFRAVQRAILAGNLPAALTSNIHIRGLAVVLGEAQTSSVPLDQAVFERMDALRAQPGILIVTNLLGYYFKYFDRIPDLYVTANWLKKAIQSRDYDQQIYQQLLSLEGPRWLAQQAISNSKEFLTQVEDLELEMFRAGRFFTQAQFHYYVKKLETIPVNDWNPLLAEVQQENVYKSRFDESGLLGHRILEILIRRAPTHGIHECWRTAIIRIGGDPRVPKTHVNWQKWWSQIDTVLVNKARGWFSELDLKLFLEAMDNYAKQSRKDDLERMFPSRKKFLENLLNKNLILHTRLYLTTQAQNYLRENYDKKDLPNYSTVSGDKSIVYVQLTGAHLIEGTHSCFLWVYHKLAESALVYDYDQSEASYFELTQNLHSQMRAVGRGSFAKITHSPQSWENQAIETLKRLGIDASYPVKGEFKLT